MTGNQLLGKCWLHQIRALEQRHDPHYEERLANLKMRHQALVARLAKIDQENQMNDVSFLLAQATCAVLRNGQPVGTAWLVNDKGILLTAGNLLCKNTACDDVYDEVQIRFSEDFPRQAYNIQLAFQEEMGIDFVILKLREIPLDRQPLPLSLAQSVRGQFRLHGYGEVLKDSATGVGEFAGIVDRQNSSSYRIFRLTSQELVDVGFNGGAVYSDDLNAVVAMQIGIGATRFGPTSRTVLAMPLYRIAQLWKPLKNLAARRAPDSVSHRDEIKPEPSKQEYNERLYHESLKQLLAYWLGAGPTDWSTRSTCRQLTNKVFQHLPAHISDAARKNPEAYVTQIRSVLIDLAQSDPVSRQLIRTLTPSQQTPTEPRPQTPTQSISVIGSGNQVITIGKDLSISAPIGRPDSKAEKWLPETIDHSSLNDKSSSKPESPPDDELEEPNFNWLNMMSGFSIRDDDYEDEHEVPGKAERFPDDKLEKPGRSPDDEPERFPDDIKEPFLSKSDLPQTEAFAIARIEGVEDNTPLHLATEYKLLTGISHEPLTNFTVQKFSLPAKEEIELDVIIHAPAFSISPQRHQRLQFVRGRNSKLLEFMLVPQEVGEQRIEVRFYYQRNWLTAVILDVTVGEAMQAEEG